MVQTIEKLEREKEKLTSQFNQNKTEYKSELRRINIAIKRFSQGYKALGTDTSQSTPKRGLASKIESILKDGALHLKQIVAELTTRGFSPRYQSVSAILQIQAKAGKTFVKTAPATFALIAAKTMTGEKSLPEQAVAFEKEPIAVGGEDA